MDGKKRIIFLWPLTMSSRICLVILAGDQFFSRLIFRNHSHGHAKNTAISGSNHAVTVNGVNLDLNLGSPNSNQVVLTGANQVPLGTHCKTNGSIGPSLLGSIFFPILETHAQIEFDALRVFGLGTLPSPAGSHLGFRVFPWSAPPASPSAMWRPGAI